MVRSQSDQVNTKESILPVCDKPYHTNKRKVQKGEEIEVLRNCALQHALNASNSYIKQGKNVNYTQNYIGLYTQTSFQLRGN